MNENYEMLVEEIKGSLEQLATLDPSDQGYMGNVRSLEVLWKLKLEEDKIALNRDVNASSSNQAKINSDNEKKKLEIEEKKLEVKKSEDVTEENRAKRESIERYVSMGINILSIVVPIAFYGKWLKTGMQFEETGTFTSKTFQGLTKFFRPTK